MKNPVLNALAATNAVLVLTLAGLWIDVTGHVRNVRWVAPAAHTSDYAAMVPVLPAQTAVDTGRFVAMLERPVFAPTRRPVASPAEAKEPASVADSLAAARLLGVFSGAQDGGAILLIDGKPRRLRLREAIDGWSLAAVQERGVTFERNGQTRSLELPRANSPSHPRTPAHGG